MLMGTNTFTTAGETQQGANSDGFTRVATMLSGISSTVREEIQATTAREIEKIITRLKGKENLTAEDLAVLRLWIVGDAESFVKMENNFPDWLEEFNRLKSVLAQYEGRDLSGKDLFSVYGLVQDAMRVASDISDYLEKKERIEKFEKAAQDLNTYADLIIDILSAKLNSPDL